MKKNIFFVVFLCAILTKITAQAQQLTIAETNNTGVISMYGTNDNRYNVLKGTPYLSAEFQNGKVLTSIVKWVDMPNIRFNTFSNKMEFMRDGQLLEASPNDVRGFKINNELFENGFSNIEKQTSNSYYQVLYDGKSKVLKYVLTEKKDVKSVDDVKLGEEFVSHDSYYLVNIKNEISKFQLSKKSVLKAFPSDKMAILESFIEKENNKVKSIEDVCKIVAYYDSL